MLLSGLFAACLFGQVVTLPAEVKGEVGDFIQVPATTEGTEVRWYSVNPDLKLFPVDLLKDTKTAVVTTRAAGRYDLIAWTAKGDKPSKEAKTTVVVGNSPLPPPVPPGPTPPGPTPPGPTPPGPTPPGPVTSFSVILAYESAATYTAAQNSVLYGVATENAIKAATAGVGNWLRLDKDTDPAGLRSPMREIWAQAKASLKPSDTPCIIFQIQDRIVIEPLPTLDAAPALIAKYRGK